MEDEQNDNIVSFSEVIKFHGHSCPGMAIGYRVSEVAIRELLSTRAEDEELVAIVENDSCSVDAIQVITGCTIGKGNLIFKDYGKQVYTFLNRQTSEAIRVSIKKSIDKLDPEFFHARQKALSSTATQKEIDEYVKVKNALTERILKEIPDEELFKIESVEMEFPEEARIFKSIYCAQCGEQVSEHRARVENGEVVCIPCFNEYSRT